ncbi:unnamed protein product [Parajaminaea phylloscopi]
MSQGPMRRRAPLERRTMEVRVWYTLDSSPHRMLAPGGRPITVELLPELRPRNTSSTVDVKGKSVERPPRFAKVTLKTCLSAICISSPELILDRQRDYILYVVDPEETYKSSVRRARQQTQSRDGRAADADSRSPSSSSSSSYRPSSSADHHAPHESRDAVFVGRGFFGWILEEEGDGNTVVLGKVSSGDDRGRTRMGSWEGGSYEDDDFEDDRAEDEYLDVEIRMKETESQSREQYFAMLRQFGSGPRSAKAETGSSSTAGSHAGKSRASQVTSDGNRAAKSGPTFARSASAPRPRYPASMSSPGKSSSAAGPPNSSTPQQTQALQVLQLLQSLQAQQQQQQQQQLVPAATQSDSTRPSTAEALPVSAVEALFKMAGFSASAATSVSSVNAAGLTRSASAPKPDLASGPGTPLRGQADSAQQALIDVFKAAGLPLPSHVVDPPTQEQATKSTSQQPVKGSSSRTASLHTKAAASEKAETTMQCYNCGVRGDSKSTWRLVVLPDGLKVEHPASFECDPTRETQDLNQQDLSVDAAGHATANGRSSWRACNRCGLFWAKWKKSRPEKIERGKTISSATSQSGKKRRRIDASARGTPLDDEDADDPRGEDDDERDEIEDSSPNGNGGSSHPTQKASKRIRRANPMQLVKDKHGQWRSKRSVQENPEGRRPGRPPGCKTGEGQGKSRGAKRKVAQADTGSEPPGTTPTVSTTQSARSPVNSAISSHHAHVPYAQSSPVRGVAASSGRHFPWTASLRNNAGGPPVGVANTTASANLTPGSLTPNRRAVRYGAPSHLLTSSPATALDALLSDGDFSFDFDSATSAAGLGRPNVTQSSPVRRSPRKNPSGTREGCNPYASYASCSGSPRMAGKDGNGSNAAALFDTDFFTAFTNFKSPGSDAVTAKRSSPPSDSSPSGDPSTAAETDTSAAWTRSRQRHHGAAQSSSMMTSLTSPASPSPTSSLRSVRRGALGKASSARRSNALMDSSSPARQALGAGDEEEGDEEEEEEGDSPSRARKQRLNSQRSASICPASPSLGQKRKRDVASSAVGSASKTTRAEFANETEMKLTKGPVSSPTASRGGMSRNATPLKPSTAANGLGAASAVKGTAKSPVNGVATPAARTSGGTPRSSALQPHRKPLPATVEDAPSSSAGSSPVDYDGLSPYDHGTVESLFDMLEDPYGLLEANGIGLAGVASGSQGGNSGAFSMEQFDSVQLHDRLQFGSHYRTFTEEGGKGVAAFALPGLAAGSDGVKADGSDSKVVESSPAPKSISGTPRSAQAGRSANPATPTKERGNPLASSTPSGHTPRAKPATPSKGTRSSPRFAHIQQEQNDSLAMPPPPSTPHRKAKTDERSSAASLNGSASKPHAAASPRTPVARSKLSPTSLALANAVVRSPALQRMLMTAAGNNADGALGDKIASPGQLDFSALFGGAANLGSLSPLFSTPAGMPTGAAPGMMTPLSPSLCRLLNSFSQEQEQLQGAELSRSDGDESADKAALVAPSAGPLSVAGPSFPADSFAELSHFLQDPDLASLLSSVAQEAGTNAL